MEWPELFLEDEKAYRAVCCQVRSFFEGHDRQLSNIYSTGRDIEGCYRQLEPFFHDYTEAICHCCPTPCCVNRHGFPDFEDLVLFNSMKIRIPKYDFHVIDTDACQFLTKNGCILPRCCRSYRCTWYFCDYVMDEFEHSHRLMFNKFDSAMNRLGEKRWVLLSKFKKLWFEEESDSC